MLRLILIAALCALPALRPSPATAKEESSDRKGRYRKLPGGDLCCRQLHAMPRRPAGVRAAVRARHESGVLRERVSRSLSEPPVRDRCGNHSRQVPALAARGDVRVALAGIEKEVVDGWVDAFSTQYIDRYADRQRTIFSRHDRAAFVSGVQDRAVSPASIFRITRVAEALLAGVTLWFARKVLQTLGAPYSTVVQ